MGCDATTLQPWNPAKYVASPGYSPLNPAENGGAAYGEKLWMVGAASDTLAALIGADDGCCGKDNDSGGCGRCLLVQNPDAVNADWTAVIMKKNRCPPWTNGCGNGATHFDFAAPGFDNLAFSTANICGNAGTGFTSKDQSAVMGSWYSQGCSSTIDCIANCDKLPDNLRAGCRLFASWGWRSGDPKQIKYKAVECPPAFKTQIEAQFGAGGVQNALVEEMGDMDMQSSEDSWQEKA